VDDLGKVKGIGPKKLEKMNTYLAIEGDTTLIKK
jgi:DNA uptake protein ComE-like DNA-binding protein